MKLQQWLYKLGLDGYKAALTLAAPLHHKAKKMVEGQQQVLQRITTAMQGNSAPVIWFHAASLGEFEQGRPLIEALRELHPQYKIFLTFFSPSGYEIRKNYAGADWIFYLPLDSPTNAQGFLAAVQPRLAVFIKYEFWHYYLQELHSRKIPTLLVSAIFRPKQLFFKPHGGFYRQMLGYFSHIFVQNEPSAHLLHSIGTTHVTVAGDTRFDRVLAISKQAIEVPLATAFASGKPVLVVGSSWEADIAVLAPLVQQYKDQLKFIIAPHEIGESSLQRSEQLLGVPTVRYTRTTAAEAREANVLLIDTIGLLSSLYSLGQWAYVGGSFGKGLHNTLEAAVWGVPVFFGNKNFQKFAEAKGLVAAGGAFAVANSSELLHQFSVLFEDKSKQERASKASADFVQQHAGATATIMEYIKKQV